MYKIQSSCPAVMCRPTQISKLVCRKMFMLLGNMPVPFQLWNYLLLAEPNKWLNKPIIICDRLLLLTNKWTLVELGYKSNIPVEVVLFYWISAGLWFSCRYKATGSVVLIFSTTARPRIWYCLESDTSPFLLCNTGKKESHVLCTHQIQRIPEELC